MADFDSFTAWGRNAQGRKILTGGRLVACELNETGVGTKQLRTEGFDSGRVLKETLLEFRCDNQRVVTTDGEVDEALARMLEDRRDVCFFWRALGQPRVAK